MHYVYAVYILSPWTKEVSCSFMCKILMEVMGPGEGRNSVDQNKKSMSLAKAVCRVPKVL